MKSNPVHNEGCKCRDCFADHLGRWIDGLGNQTFPGHWQVFVTITYKTPTYPWQQGFPQSGSGRPNPDFAHHLFDRLVGNLQDSLASRLDYVVADQYGERFGRFHQHAILAANGLDLYPRTQIWNWLKEHAGWSRVLPFEHGAAYYISRYIGKDANRCDWALRVGENQLADLQPATGGGL